MRPIRPIRLSLVPAFAVAILAGCTSINPFRSAAPVNAEHKVPVGREPIATADYGPDGESGKSGVNATDDTGADSAGRVGQTNNPTVKARPIPIKRERGPIPIKRDAPLQRAGARPPDALVSGPALPPPDNPPLVGPGEDAAIMPPVILSANGLLSHAVGTAKPGPSAVAEPLPPGNKKAGPDSIFDPHCRTSPTAAGCLLNLGPNESAVERAVELAKLLDVCEAENRVLTRKLKALEATLEGRERMLRDDEVELTKAAEDLIQARADLQRLRDEFGRLRLRLQQAEREDLETLRAIVTALEKLLETGSGP